MFSTAIHVAFPAFKGNTNKLAESLSSLLSSVQVSDTPPDGEESEGSGLSEGSGIFEASGLFEGSGEEVDGSGLSEGGEQNDDDMPIYFYLEESTGYMQPTLAFLAALHTVISFICIIGYNCLKVEKPKPYFSLSKDGACLNHEPLSLRFHWWSSNGRKNLQESWNLMDFTSLSSRKRMT